MRIFTLTKLPGIAHQLIIIFFPSGAIANQFPPNINFSILILFTISCFCINSIFIKWFE